MYDDAHPQLDANASPASDGQTQESNQESSATEREKGKNPPGDNAEVSGSVQPPAPVSPAPAPPAQSAPPTAGRKPRLPQKTKEEKAVEEAEAVEKKAKKATEIAREKLAESRRMVTFLAAQRIIHAALLAAEKQSRESALGSLEILLDEAGQQTLKAYMVALEDAAEAARIAEKKKLESQPGQE